MLIWTTKAFIQTGLCTSCAISRLTEQIWIVDTTKCWDTLRGNKQYCCKYVHKYRKACVCISRCIFNIESAFLHCMPVLVRGPLSESEFIAKAREYPPIFDIKKEHSLLMFRYTQLTIFYFSVNHKTFTMHV